MTNPLNPPDPARANGHIPLDYHMHTLLSCDSHATMAEMCRGALQRGIHEIAFTEHLDFHPADSSTGFYRPAVYFETLAAARAEFGPQGLTIRAGLEVGEYHRWTDAARSVLDAWPYDFVLGSLHWVGDQNVFDGDYFRRTPLADVTAAYFSELAELARGGGFDVLAHPDVFKRVAYDIYGAFDIADWEDLVRPVWRACIDNGIGIEINTAGLRRSVAQAHPPLDALRWYREMGGELLTLGSDAHQPDHVGFGLDTALELARAAGFRRVCCYDRRQVVGWRAI